MIYDLMLHLVIYMVCSPTEKVSDAYCLRVFPVSPVISCLSGHPVTTQLDVASHTHFLIHTPPYKDSSCAEGHFYHSVSVRTDQ